MSGKSAHSSSKQDAKVPFDPEDQGKMMEIEGRGKVKVYARDCWQQSKRMASLRNELNHWRKIGRNAMTTTGSMCTPQTARKTENDSQKSEFRGKPSLSKRS